MEIGVFGLGKEWSLSSFDKNKKNLMFFTDSFKCCGICNNAPLVLLLGILYSLLLLCNNPFTGIFTLNLCCLYTNPLSVLCES